MTHANVFVGWMVSIASAMTLATTVVLASTDVTLQGSGGVQRVRIQVPRMDGTTTGTRERFLRPGSATSWDWSGTIDRKVGRERVSTRGGYDFEGRVASVASRTVLTRSTALSASGGAAVGLYPSLSSSSPLPDSTMSVDIYRDPDFKRLTLSLRGGLRTWSSDGLVPRATFKLIVFPDLATADQDRGNRGAGSIFYGEITLADRITTDGGFTSSDFVLQEQEGSERTLRSSGTISMHLVVPDAEAAVVRLVADTDGGTAVEAPLAAPGTNAIGLGLLALVLAGAGCWSLRRVTVLPRDA